jgi:hypothetical protein
VSENSSAVSYETISPELALVDPDLRARARAALPAHPIPAPLRPASPPPVQPAEPATPPSERAARYPAWARITATLWVLVVGILIGGVAVPHAQDRPRVVPPDEDVTICEPARSADAPAGTGSP